MPKKNSSVRKTSTPKRKTTRSRAKKPKVKLAKNKVAMLCGLICGVCVLAIGLSIALNQEKKPVPQKTEVIAKSEPVQTKQKPVQKQPEQHSKPSQIQKQSQMQAEPVKPEVKAEKPEAAKVQKPVKEVSKPKQAETKSPEKKEKPEVKNEKQQEKPKAEKKKPAQKNTQQPKIITKEMKESSSVKTIPKNQVSAVVPPKTNDTIQQNVPRNRFDIPPASNGATIVIVIDDAGRSVENTKRYASLPFPITIAVLPKLAQSRACADAVRAAGKEVILHQPMQSLNHNLNPGPGKITSEMSTYEIAQIVKQNLEELGPGVKGMNNHEGSDVTSNEIKIGAVLEVCAEKGVYFLDSRTTADTKAPQAALERDMHIFEKAGPYLDNDIDRAKMAERIRETLMYANRHGRAIVIGHVDKSVNILPDLLAEMYPEIKAAGYHFATPGMLKN